MTTATSTPTQQPTDNRAVVLKRYDESLGYYWRNSRYNWRSYKATRYLAIILGAAVTLISSLSAAKMFEGNVNLVFAVLTPILAACMSIITGISQAFRWGGTWSDGVITATRLQKERDRISVIPPDQLDAVKELTVLDELVLAETQGFFQRLFGTGGPSREGSGKLQSNTP
jgi:hypothetical protein